jgi:hypothetical protein
MSYIETTTHRRRTEIAAEKWSLFRSYRGLAAPDLFLDTMVNRRTCAVCSIVCTEAMDNIYRNISQIWRLKGKTYRCVQLGELVYSVTVEHTLEHKIIYGSKPTGEKREEGETAADRHPHRVSVCEVAMSSQG